MVSQRSSGDRPNPLKSVAASGQTLVQVSELDFEAFFSKTFTQLTRWFYEHTDIWDEAEDLADVTLQKVYYALERQNMSVYGAGLGPLAWKIAHDEWANWWRRKVHEKSVHDQYLMQLRVDGGRDTLPEEAILQTLAREALDKAVEQLEYLERQIITLRRLGFSHDEIAALISVPARTLTADAVRQRYSRALGQIREFLKLESDDHR